MNRHPLPPEAAAPGRERAVHAIEPLLRAARAYPSISLLAPIGRASGPDSSLRALVSDAAVRLRQEFAADVVARYVEALERAVDQVAPLEGRRSVAVFVNDQTEQVVDLAIVVRERVVIDDTFATRDIVRAEQRSVRYRVLTLDERVSRLYEGFGVQLTEVQGGALPFAFRDDTDTPTGRREPATTRLQRYVRELGAAVAPQVRDDPLPVVLAGAEPRLTAVRRSGLAGTVVGTVPTVRDRPRPRELAQLVWPHVDVLHTSRVEAALDQLADTPDRLVASGVGDVWYVAGQGRGELLLVEESFEFPALLEERTGAVQAAADRDAPGVVDDLVDEAIELVLEKRGRCVAVPDGTLDAHDRIALVMRY